VKRLGVLGLTFVLPVVSYALLFLCNDVSGCPVPSLLHPSSFTLDKLKQDVNWRGPESIISAKGFYGAFAWYGFSLLLYTILPATEVEGTLLSKGGRLKYRFNGKLVALC